MTSYDYYWVHLIVLRYYIYIYIYSTCLYVLIWCNFICNIGWACDNAKFARHRPGSWSHTHPRTSGSACQPAIMSQHVTTCYPSCLSLLLCRRATSNASMQGESLILDATWCYLMRRGCLTSGSVRKFATGHGPHRCRCAMSAMGYGPSLAVDSGKRRQCQDGLNKGQEKGDDSYAIAPVTICYYMLLFWIVSRYF